MPSAGVSIRRFRRSSRLVPVVLGAPHVDVVGLAVAEDVADLLALDLGRGGAAHVTGLEPDGLRLVQVDAHLHLGDLGLRLRLQARRALDGGERVVDLLRLGPQDGGVGAVDADDDRVAGAGEDLPDPLLQVGLGVPDDARVSVDRRGDGLEGRVVVRLGVDGDPVLAELRPHRLVGLEGLADVGAEVAHPGDRLQFLGRRRGDPHLLGQRGARLREEVHQEVALLELGEQRLPEAGARRRRRP